MNARGWTLVAILLTLGIIGFCVWKFWPQPVPAPSLPEVTTETPNLEGQVIYASGEYGFIVRYPESAYPDDSVAWAYHLSSEWRNGREGHPVVAIFSYTHESDHAYPRYYAALVRIGVSDDPDEVVACEKPESTLGEEILPDRVIQGVTWKAFSFGDAAMMQYVKGVSYRTVHEGKCYALEQIATGSSYRDDPVSADDISDATLEAEYQKLLPILDSFTFTRP